MAKYYKPSDFTEPRPDEHRQELIDLINTMIEDKEFTYSKKLLTIKAPIADKYTDDQLKDVCSHYALNGGWKVGAYSRTLDPTKVSNMIRFSFEAK